MLSQEHLINILVSCSTREEELRAERAAMLANRELATMVKAREFGWPPEAGLLDTYDPKKAAELFETFADYGTWQAPTLAVSSYYAETPERTPELIMRAGLSGEELEKFRAHARRMLARYQELVGEMHRAGVLLLAGSDAGEATDVPMGAGLHRELELLVGSGLTPLEALQTATLNPAMYLGTLSLMGTIASGKVGDLVLLDANPLEDIRNTRKIRAVVMRGKLYTRETIDGWSVPNVQ
jgi:hypothetical protein